MNEDLPNGCEIIEILNNIRPTKEEVEDMSEDEWMRLIYPIKCFHAGRKYQKLEEEAP